MIPKLYEGNVSDIDSALREGLGRLPDALSCNVVEERNGQFELSMVYPAQAPMFKELQTERIIRVKPNDTSNEQNFRIYKITTPLNGKVTINAHHISYDLSGVPVTPTWAEGIQDSLDELVTNSLLDMSQWTFWTNIENTASEFNVQEMKSFRANLGGSEGSILDVFGGEFEWDNHIVRLHASRGEDNGVRIEYGKNLTDLNREDNTETWYTGVVAFWKSEDAIASGDIQYVSNHASYPREKIYILDCTSDYEQRPSRPQLNAKANAYLRKNQLGVPKVNIKASFVPLWQSEEYKDLAPLEHVSLCDTVTVYYPAYDVDVKTKVIAYDYDVLKERYRSITLGDARSNLSSTIQQQIDTAIEKTQSRNSQLYTSDSTIYNTVPTVYSSGTDSHYITRYGMAVPWVYAGNGQTVRLDKLNAMATAAQVNTVLVLTAHNSTPNANTLWLVRRTSNSNLCVQIGGGTGVISVTSSNTPMTGTITVTSTGGSPSVYFMPVDGSAL